MSDPARHDLVEALEEIVRMNQEREWTGDPIDGGSGWIVRDGHYAKLARAALASEAASQVPADERLDRLEAAIEGELEGLAITRDQAIKILVYVDTGLDLGLSAAPDQEGPADGKCEEAKP